MIPKLLATIIVGLSTFGCAREEPEPLPVGAYVGCYRASDAPALNLLPDIIHFENGPSAPFRIEMRKVGLVVAVPLVGQHDKGRLILQRVQDHYYYRLLPSGADPIIQFVARAGETVSYRRTSLKPCSA